MLAAMLLARFCWWICDALLVVGGVLVAVGALYYVAAAAAEAVETAWTMFEVANEVFDAEPARIWDGTWPRPDSDYVSVLP